MDESRAGLNMPEQRAAGACNIGARGRLVRLVAGLVTVLAGVVLLLLLLAGPLTGLAWWAVGVGAILGGLFQVYEGWAGWCVLRAMGFRTPL